MANRRHALLMLTVLLVGGLRVEGPWPGEPAALEAATCVPTPEYWRTHPSLWPLQSLVLGAKEFPGHTYQKAELLALLNTPSAGDPSLTLAVQLIAVKLNIASGATPPFDALAKGDKLLAAVRRRLPYGTQANTQAGRDMTSVAGTLERYNSRQLVSCTPANTPPVADAGLDATGFNGDTITLDGSRSTDANGDPLTYRWTLVTRPATSLAQLLNDTTVKPSFVIDVSGDYVARLIVNDGTVDSVADDVRVTTRNSLPIANAGASQNVVVGAVVQLDGSGSTDVDRDPLTYEWNLMTVPAGSAAALSDASAVKPTFSADVVGLYVVQLIVHDPSSSSTAATVSIDAQPSPPLNRAPVADAGAAQTVAIGAMVTLAGSASSDPDGDPLTYRWSLTSPAGSSAELDDPLSVNPSFVADLAGTYVAQLIVNDGTVDSAPDTVSISTENSTPAADAGPDQTVAAGVTVQLDGSASFDPDGSALLYGWSLTSRPPGSNAALSNDTIVNPTFVADVDGTYVAQLIVGDGALLSSPDTVAVTAAPGADLNVTFFRAANQPAVGANEGWGIQIFNLGPAATDNVRIHAPLPAGYTFLSAGPSSGTYDSATGVWTIGRMDAGAAPNISIGYRVNATGPYDLVASVLESSAPDPNQANNTRTQIVTPEGNADLNVTFFRAADQPAVGSNEGWGIQIFNLGPAATDNVRIHAPLPAGYTFLSAGASSGTYDSATGVWTIGRMDAGAAPNISIGYRVNVTGPYDLVASVLESSAPDSNPANNTRTQIVTPNTNADLEVRVFNPNPGLHQPGDAIGMLFDVVNAGPADAANVIVELKIPAGLTFTAVDVTAGTTYDPVTGAWAIGGLPNGHLARLNVSLRVNVTGSMELRAAVVNSSAPDPNLANNVVVPARMNRPPVANARADQSASTHALVPLDGGASFDADGDPITFAWSYALRPINSAATLTSVTSPASSFTPDLPGNYVVQLVVRDSFGVASVPDTSTISTIVTNSPPAIVSAPVTSTAVSQSYQYDVNATDLDPNDVLAFSLITPPAGMIIDISTGVINWTPGANQAGPQSVVVRVQDAGGLFATQSFVVQVGSPGNGQPAAVDDVYEARVGQSLSVGAPGVVGNDTDESVLSARLVTLPGNGAALLNADGSFTYTPHTLQPGEFVLAENVNLAARIPGVTVVRSAANCPRCAIDEDITTKWDSFGGPIEIVFPAPVTVSQVTILATLNPNDHKITAGIFELIDGSGMELYDSGPVAIPGPPFNATLIVPNVPGVRRVRFTPTASPTFLFSASLAELKVIGSGLIRREPFVEPNLVQLLPATVTASSEFIGNVKESLTDDSDASNWFSNGNAGDFIEVTFPIDTTVTQLRALNPSGRPDGFGTSLGISCAGTFVFLDAARSVLFDSGLVNEPSGSLHPSDIFTLDVPNLTGVRHIRYTVSGCTGNFPAGFSEWRVIGSAELTTPAFGLGEKFQSLHGREAHSTPLVVNLTDDNLDGAINADDIPDIIVPVEAIGDQLKGEIKAISGDDGRELFTAGGPNLVSPWSELAAADIDGDGMPEIVAVHSDGNHLIAFEHTGVQKWISDANPMPSFNIGAIVYTGAISIANLDGAGPPEIVVGASVFDADGRLLGDGRTLGGTTGGVGLRSAISAVGDIDLDGTAELVAGPTAYRSNGGQLTKVWQRTDRSDGYVGIANLDDDPQAEIVSVANGVVYVLNHDGSDQQDWNPPAHTPVAIPGGGQGGAPLIVDVDGDGRPEIGVAASSHFVLFNRDGSIRWMSAISDRTSNSTGAVAFDLNGDGEVEIIYRDEFFLRIYRGADGVLLAKTAVGSATWSEEPVVADVDNDGHADIVVASDFFRQTADDTGIIVFQDVANKWKRTRRIWNQHGYHVTNVNEDASIPLTESTHWLISGINAFRTNAFVPGESTEETDSFTYVASDGVLDSNPATVHIAIRTPNSAPQMASSPATSAADGVAYSYAAQAVDPDAGDILTFSLPTAPAGMSIDPQSGLVQWLPTASQQGSHSVIVKVADVRGLFALQAYQISVAAPLTVPDIVGQLQTAAENAIASAGFSVGGVTSRHSAANLQGTVISQNPVASAAAAPGSPVNFVLSLGAPPAGTVPNVVGLTQTSAQQDVAAAGFASGVTGQSNAVVPAGIVLSQNPAGGTVAPSSTVVNLVVSLGPPPGTVDLDLDGFTGNQGDCNDTNAAINPAAFDVPGDGIDQNCNGVDSIAGDGTFPVVVLESPAEDAEITLPTDIVGTVSDAHFLRYTLTFERINEAGRHVIATGTVPVASNVVGRFDPTLLENGLYLIRLAAEDLNGQIAVDERVYRVSGNAKVGVMSLAFIDLQVPVAGIPITVVRSYDSRVKTQRDFGVGWSLQVKAGTYQNNRRPGDAWIVATGGGPFGLPCAVVTETRSHSTEVRLSDREFYVFRPRLVNLAPVVGGCVGTVSFEQIGGSTMGASLAVVGNADIIYTSGSVLTEFDGSGSTGLIFDPRQVRLTTFDGRVIDVDQSDGVTHVQDRNGSALTIAAGGITHSSGKSIAFTRDAFGRIVRIVDPAGNQLVYGYDGDGDLTEFVDQVANRTTFTYDGRHNLLELRDPHGIVTQQGEYDPDGRLIAVIDAAGNRIDLTHDLSGRQETMKDRLGRTIRHEYDVNGNITLTIDALGRRHEFTYDNLGNQLTETDPLGRTRSMTYDANGNTLTATDFDGNQTTYSYNLRGQRVSKTDPTGRSSFSRYDANGNLIKETDGAGGETNYTVDSTGNPTAVRDPLGNTTTHSYDSSGNHTLATDAAGATRSFAYDSLGNPVTSTERRTVGGSLQALITQSHYDAAGRVIEQTNPAGETLTFTHDEFGAPATITDPAGDATQLIYDVRGHVARVEFADGSNRRYTYDAEGRLTSTIDRDGFMTRLDRPVVSTPDGMVERRVTTYADGSTRILEPDVVGRPSLLVDERHNSTIYAYQPNLKRVTDPLGNLTIHRLDGAGRPIEMVDALNRAWRVEYDGAGRQTRLIDPAGNARSFAYDAAGRKVSERDENGLTTTFGYDVRGRLTRVIDPAGATTLFEYDEVGSLVRHTDPLGRGTGMAYDAGGRLVRRQRPLGQAETFAYDVAGNLVAHTDFNGQTTTLAYDSNDRLIGKHLPNGRDVLYAFTAEGRRLRAGADTFVYDARGRLVEDHKSSGEVISYTYDAAGNRTSVTTPAGVIRYTFDALNRLATVIDGTGTTTYSYDAVGNLASTTTPDRATTAYTYDLRNRLTQVVTSGPGGLIASYTYTLDLAGRRTRVVEAGPGTMSRTVDYTYDTASRLVRERIDAAGAIFDRDISYTYDASGNRLRKTSVTAAESADTVYTYDANDRLLTETTTVTIAGAIPGEPFMFTPLVPTILLLPVAAGALALLVVWRRRAFELLPARAAFNTVIVYELVAALVILPTLAEAAHASAMPALASQPPAPDVLTYTYDNNGNMLTRSNGLATDSYTYDPENRLISADVQIAPVSGRHRVDFAYDADGARTSRTVNGVTTSFLVDKSGDLSQVLVENTAGNVVQYTYGLEVINQTRAGSGARFYHFDGHHSTRQLTDETGAVTDTYDYDAFGVQLFGTGTTPNDFRYTGQQFDPNIGFYYMRARYYAQAMGRFITTDPFDGVDFDPPSLHRYLYASADPVNRWDPSGEMTLTELMSTISFYGQWIALSIFRPLLNNIAVAGGRVLGNRLLQGFVLRFATRLGPQTVARILVKTGIQRGLANRLALELTSPVVDGFAGPAVELFRSQYLLGILIALFAGEEARASEDVQQMAPQTPEETFSLAAFVVFMEEDFDIIPPRIQRVVGTLIRLLNRLLPGP